LSDRQTVCGGGGLGPEAAGRLFLAIEVAQSATAHLAGALEGLHRDLARHKWVESGKYHLTLAFLGETPAKRVADLDRAAARAAEGVKRGSARLVGLGAFPTPRRARVLWAGVDDVDGTLEHAAARLRRSLDRAGFPVESRRFVPHLTLCRFREPVDLDGRLEVPTGSEAFGVNELVLFRSHLSGRVPQYEPLARYAFSHPARRDDESL